MVDWHASNSSRLFPDPHGLVTFADNLDLPLQLYAPFWSDKYQSKYNMTESTVFHGTKLVTPDDSYSFFSDFFDLGLNQTRKRFVAFEIDFLDANFAGSDSMFTSVSSADMWYQGMASAALERNIVLQYCLPSATDMLESLAFPAVIQARASGDYVNTVDNAFQIGGSALLMGAVAMAPSKDTLWTASPQPATYSDTHQRGDYTTQPHVGLDCVLATLSLGPVGISDGLNQTDVFLISQAFRSPSDSTLLRPDRPVSWVDSYFINTSLHINAADVRSTHSQVPTVRPPSDITRSGHNSAARGAPRVTMPPPSATNTLTTHYVVAWRTTVDVTLGPFDLYPAPAPGARLAVRKHIAGPTSAAQQAGCVDGAAAQPSCVSIFCSGCGPVIPSVGGDLSNYSLTVVYEPLSNGAYFLGELSKFVHVAPQRFEYVVVDATAGGRAGLVVGVRGSAGQHVTLTAVTAGGIVSVASVTLTSGISNVPL